MLKNKHLGKTACVFSLLALGFTSCGYTDETEGSSDNGYREASTSLAYEKAFTQNFGQIAANQSWDFSSYAVKTGTRASANNGVTLGSDGYYHVEDRVLEYMKENLVEGHENLSLGESFQLIVSGDVTIIPIYQGGASKVWDLHMVYDGNDAKLWEKHQDIFCQLTEEAISKDVSNNIANQDNKYAGGKMSVRDTETWYHVKESFTLEPGGWWQNYEYGYNTLGAKAIKTTAITTNVGTAATPVSFYLRTWESAEAKINNTDPIDCGSHESDTEYWMVALPCPKPLNIEADKAVYMIGCEDNKASNSDKDANDLVFLVVADNIQEMTPSGTVKQYLEIKDKRYMVEDLGNTDDFDFNDIVIDFQQEQKVTEYYDAAGNLTNTVRGDKHQRAILRHLGGTLKWQVFLKGYEGAADYAVTTYRDGVLGSDPNEKIELEGAPWYPDANNIYLKVQQSGKTVDSFGNVMADNTVSFPKEGSIPMIIATDINQTWMAERQKINFGWFATE